MSEKVEKSTVSSMCIPMTEEDSKKMHDFYNKLLKNSNNPTARVLWAYGEKNIDALAKDFVKKRCEGILGDEDMIWCFPDSIREHTKNIIERMDKNSNKRPVKIDFRKMRDALLGDGISKNLKGVLWDEKRKNW